ncbi:CCA tRNA nucleotidyltransferase [Alteromonas sp. ASW11-19]|uniref:CCA-adding enzyme n=1 Tax=Alteromonas salexigens TaxID=2982530 RepID=A0ABT2VSK0_9ALTE|nr:CCA tRNA nucleotidyltransferase [Alteromonas salexigens]
MQTYLVGGAVRDELLGRPVTEKDWVVVGATPQIMLEKGYTQVGKDFPVFLHPRTKDEYALARTERKAGTGYTGFVCDASASVTLEQDLQRRDLTVNAIAKDANGELIDPYHGVEDIAQRVLRHVSDAFSEDPLRVFRVARFACRYHYLGFSVAPATMALMRTMAASGELEQLTAERVWQETSRSLMEQSPQVFFEVLSESNALASWFAELPPVPNPEYEALAKAANDNAPLETRMAVLCSGLTPEQTDTLLTRLKAPNVVADLAKMSARCSHTLMNSALQATDIVELFNNHDAWRKPARFAALLDTAGYLASVTRVNGYSSRRHALEQALQAANEVDVKAIVASGVKGPDIKKAVFAARCEAVAEFTVSLQ